MTATQNRPRDLWAGAAVLFLLLFGYMLLWWNRGIQLNSNGLGNLAAQAILAGRMPYLDFHYWCPPGDLFVYTFLTACFGDGLIYVRAFAVVERMAIFLILYFWLARIYSVRAAFFGTFAAGVGFSSDSADVLVHYDFEAALALVAAGFSASIAIASQGRRREIMWFIAGLGAGACMLAKQTQGVGMLLVLLVIAASTRKLSAILSYLFGWALLSGLTLAWLQHGGALHAFFQQVFLQGTSAKGSLRDILLRPLVTLTYQHSLQAAILLAAVFSIWVMMRGRPDALHPPATPAASWKLWLVCLLVLLAGIAWAWWLPGSVQSWRVQSLMILITAVCIYIGFYGSLVFALRYTMPAFLGRLDSAALQAWILASVSAGTAYMYSISWGAYEKMLIPGFAFLTAFALDRQLKNGWGRKSYAIVALGLVLIATAGIRKLTTPYNWENWADGPVRAETATVAMPELRGIYVSPASAAFLTRVTAIVDAHSQPGQTILCYPNYTLFYVLAHRRPAVFAYMHWFDIVSDALARDDAERIRRNPPAVMLMVDLPEPVVLKAEDHFRGGRRSGQRDLAATIQSLPGYRLVETVPIPLVEYGLKIYARD